MPNRVKRQRPECIHPRFRILLSKLKVKCKAHIYLQPEHLRDRVYALESHKTMCDFITNIHRGKYSGGKARRRKVCGSERRDFPDV